MVSALQLCEQHSESKEHEAPCAPQSPPLDELPLPLEELDPPELEDELEPPLAWQSIQSSLTQSLASFPFCAVTSSQCQPA